MQVRVEVWEKMWMRGGCGFIGVGAVCVGSILQPVQTSASKGEAEILGSSFHLTFSIC